MQKGQRDNNHPATGRFRTCVGKTYLPQGHGTVQPAKTKGLPQHLKQSIYILNKNHHLFNEGLSGVQCLGVRKRQKCILWMSAQTPHRRSTEPSRHTKLPPAQRTNGIRRNRLVEKNAPFFTNDLEFERMRRSVVKVRSLTKIKVVVDWCKEPKKQPPTSGKQPSTACVLCAQSTPTQHHDFDLH